MTDKHNSDEPSGPAGLSASEVIARFGGIRPMATKLGISFTTVQGWKTRDHIPAQRHAEIVALAEKHGISLAPGAAAETAPAAPSQPESAPVEAPPPPPPATPAPPRLLRPPPEAPPLPPRGIGMGGAVLVSVIVVAAAVALGYASRPIWHPAPSAAAASPAMAALERTAAELRDRIARLEQDLAARAAPGGPVADGEARAAAAKAAADAAALGERLAAAEQALAAARREAGAANEAAQRALALGARVEALEKAGLAAAEQAKGLRAELDALAKKLDGLAKSVEGLAPRLAGIEQQVQQGRAAALGEAAQILMAGQLRAAVERGGPFANELSAARALSGGEAKLIEALNALQPFAAVGVPGRQAVIAGFEAAASEIVRAGLKRSQTGWLRTLIDKLDSLVTVRPVGPDVKGNDARAKVARAEAALAKGDLASAAAQLDGLDPAPAAAAKPWLDKAKARFAAEAALSAIDAQATAALATRAGKN